MCGRCECRFLADETYQPRFTYKDARAASAACASMTAKDEFALLAVKVLDRVIRYRGTSLIRNTPLLEPYSRPMPRALRWS